MNTLYLIGALITTFLISCNSSPTERSYKNSHNGLVQSNIISKCKCFGGVGSQKGDSPVLSYLFTTGKSVIICGFIDKEMEGFTISEFNVFDCANGNSLVEYDATQICKVVEKKDTLQINEYKYFPIAKNYEWELIKISKQYITLISGEIVVSKLEPDVEKFNVDNKTAENFFSSIQKGKGINKNWEKEIGFLEALSILGNQKAWNILQNYESYTGQETDGAIAETWKEAVATVEWIKQ